MDRYFTIMIVPERDKGVRSIRMPRVVFHALTFLCVAVIGLLSILIFDYWKILKQVHENKHLTIENRQLKEQIQLNQMKINAVTEDIERIRTFEKKLRIITGLQDTDLTQSARESVELESFDLRQGAPANEKPEEGPQDPSSSVETKSPRPNISRSSASLTGTPLSKAALKDLSKNEEYQNLKDLYEKKIATTFGLQTGYAFTKEWSDLTKQSFNLASQFAKFDYLFNTVKNYVETLEVRIHELDQYLLDKESFLRSTPTLMPAQGWITSYYGPRISPTSGYLRMHEGLDIGAVPGVPIRSPADGIVTFSGVKPGFGNFVQIDHGYGLETIYAHAKSLVATKGQRIKRGDKLATVGSTGYSTGPHLHYEVRVNGTPVDPLYFILN